MRNKFSLSILILITFLGFFIRFFQLGKAPAGLYLDEAAQGYNAYSILKTGKDEFGMFLPVIFRSFADFKTPVYIYLITPLIPIFGLTPFTVRFPSFIFSVMSIPLLFLLIRQLSPPKMLNSRFSLLATLMLAISPWHTLFGRTNFECNVALFFLLSALFTFYLSLKKPPLLVLSAFFFALTIPSYHSQRVIVPLLLLILFIRHHCLLLSSSHRRFAFSAFIFGIFLSLPTLSVIMTPGFLARASTLNIFTQVPSGFLSWYNGPFFGLVNAKWYLSTIEFLSLYSSYFSPRNLFFLGDYGPRSSFPDLSTFFTWQFPFYLYGLYRMLVEKKLGELRFIMFALLLISPIPAAVTRDPFTTIRALPMVIPLSFIIALGLVRFYERISARFRKVALLVLCSVIIYSLANLYSSVIILNEKFRAPFWDYGWYQVVDQLNSLDQNLPVVIDNARAEPYSQILFFTKFDPVRYQSENFEVPLSEYYSNLNRNPVKNIGRITVRSINWEPDLIKEQYLVGDSIAISLDQISLNQMTLIEEIDYPDGTPAYRIVLTNPKYQQSVRALYKAKVVK